MKYIRLKTTDPYYNLAAEEYLFRNGDEDIFMLWQNSPSVIIGKNQNAYAEVALDCARAEGINIVRRITGGGAVYHDSGNVNFSFITSAEKAAALDFAYFTRPIISALGEMGLDCSLSGRNDLEFGGRKFSGNAQFSDGRRILHHGTLLFDSDLDIMERVLRADREKLEYKAVRSHRGRVINLKEALGDSMTAEEFIRRIEKHVTESLGAKAEILSPCDGIETLRARNASEEWIYSSRRYLTDYTLRRRKKYPFGIVEIKLRLKGDTVEEAIVSGDFFGERPIGELEKALRGLSIEAFSSIDPSPYIAGMSGELLAELIADRDE